MFLQTMLVLVERLAAELLERAQHKPGESMFVLAERLGLDVRTTSLELPVRGAAVRGMKRVLVVESGYPSRDQFTLAHEIVELFMPSEWTRTMLISEDDKETLCDRGAAALLLPKRAFTESVARIGIELPALRKRWVHVSWATIARRLVDIGAASTAAYWESLEIVWRYGGEAHSDEEHALAVVYTGRGRARVRSVSAWRLCGAGLGYAVSVAC